jgi:hypothetical protein
MGKRKLPLIMIADADEEERSLMRAILKLLGFDVVEAWDSRQRTRSCWAEVRAGNISLGIVPGGGDSASNQRFHCWIIFLHLPNSRTL